MTDGTEAGTDRKSLRRSLIAARRELPDRAERVARLEAVLEAWLASSSATVIGAYWPIRGEFDPLPALGRWLAGGESGEGVRSVGLPVVDPATNRLRFRLWHPGCEMVEDAYGIPAPAGDSIVEPDLLLAPCVGFGPGGVRLGYGGGFYDRTLAALDPRPATTGIAFVVGFVPWLRAEPHDIPLDTILTEDGPAA